MADKEDDFEAELKKLESTKFDDDDDDASIAMGGFPGDTGGFPDDEPEASTDDEDDLFAGSFDDAFAGADEAGPAEPDDAYPGDEEDAGEPDFGAETDELVFDDEPEFDPAAEEDDGEQDGLDADDVDADVDSDDDSDGTDDPFADDEPVAASGKGNMILYGGLATVALLVGGAGFTVMKPMLTGGNTPPAAVSPLEAPTPAAFQPGSATPAAIPQPTQASQPTTAPGLPPSMPPALPSPSGERVQVPGYPANVDQSGMSPRVMGAPVALPGASPTPSGPTPPAMPELGRPALTAPSAMEPQPILPTPVPAAPSLGMPSAPLPNMPAAAEPADVIVPAAPTAPQMPSLGLDETGPAALPFGSASKPVAPLEAPGLPGLPSMPDEIPQPTTAPLPAAEVETNAVLEKMDALMARFADLETKFVTEDDVSGMIDAAVAKVTINGGSEGFTAVDGTIKELTDRVASLQEQLASTTALSERIAQLEARFTQEPASLEIASATPKEATPEAPVKVEVDADAKAADAKAAEIKKAEEAKKAAAAKAAKLQATVAKQQAEIVALKARGGDVTPPSKPTVHSGYRLAGLSSNQAWIESPGGMSRYSVGQQIPGVGLIKEFRQMDGNYVVVTNNGIITP